MKYSFFDGEIWINTKFFEFNICWRDFIFSIEKLFYLITPFGNFRKQCYLCKRERKRKNMKRLDMGLYCDSENFEWVGKEQLSECVRIYRGLKN